MLLLVPAHAQKLIALSYHDVVTKKNGDVYAVTSAQLRSHLDFLERAGYQPISLNYLRKVQQGKLSLPDRAVLLFPVCTTFLVLFFLSNLTGLCLWQHGCH